jgi:hypothetical protein
MKDRAIQLTDGTNELQGIDLRIEVARDSDGLITQGMVIGNTMNQNQALILVSNPGEFKFSPTLGVAIDGLLLDHDFLRFRHRIRDHFKKDGLKTESIQLAENKPLIIQASYEQ